MLSTASSASAGLLLLLYAAAGYYLTQPDFGIFTYGLTLAALAETFFDLGMHQVTIRAIARDRASAPRLLHNTLALKAVPTLLVLAVALPFVWLAKTDSQARLVCALMVLSSVPRTYFATVRGVLLGLERFGRDTALVVADRAALLVVGVAALHAGFGLVGLAVAFVVVRLVIVVASLLVARGLVGTLALGFDTALWRDLQQTALPVGLFLVAFGLYSYIDVVMLEWMTDDVSVGLYGAAYRIYEGLCYAPAVVAAVLGPRLASLWVSDRNAHRHLARRGLAAAAGLAVVAAGATVLLAGPVVRLVFPGTATENFDSAAPTLRLLAAGLPFIFSIWILHTAAISVFRQGLLLRTTLIGVAANATLNLFLIPRYGPNGAALATVLGEGITVGLLLIGLRDVLGTERKSLPKP